jgi:hypothetical protein
MADIYVCGHGGWRVIGMSSVFVDVPAFTEVVFYKDIGWELDLTEAEAILRGDANAPQPERTVASFSHCPDMSLLPSQYDAQFAAAATTGGVNAFVVTAETKLSDLLEQCKGNRIHWMACSSRGLRH